MAADRMDDYDSENRLAKHVAGEFLRESSERLEGEVGGGTHKHKGVLLHLGGSAAANTSGACADCRVLAVVNSRPDTQHTRLVEVDKAFHT